MLLPEGLNTSDTFSRTLSSLQQIQQLREQKANLDKVNAQNLQSMQDKIKRLNNDEYEQMVYDQFDRRVIMSDSVATYDLQRQLQDAAFSHQKMHGLLEQSRYEASQALSLLQVDPAPQEPSEEEEAEVLLRA